MASMYVRTMRSFDEKDLAGYCAMMIDLLILYW